MLMKHSEINNLTPGHIFIGSDRLSLPEPDFLNEFLSYGAFVCSSLERRENDGVAQTKRMENLPKRLIFDDFVV